MAASGIRLNKQDIINALKEKKGVLSHVAEQINCHRTTLYTWIKEDEDVAKALEEGREQLRLDYLEKDQEIVKKAYCSMSNLLDNNDVTATIFSLKCKAGWLDSNKTQSSGTIIKANDQPWKNGERN